MTRTPQMTDIRHKGLKSHPGTTNDIVFEKVQGNGEKNQKVEFLEKRRWRKAGANVTDYFNYGFDEESWKAYCRKQAELRGMKRKLNAKNRAQKRHTGYEEEEASCAYSSPGRPSILAFRESEPIANLVGGQPESSRQDGHQCLNDGGSNTQMCLYEDSSNAYQLPAPLSNKSLFEVIKTRAPPCPQPPSSTATLVSGNSKGFNSPSASLCPYSSRRITISPGVIDTAKARECYILQEKRDKDRDSSRAHGQDKENKRSSYREKEGCSSSYYRERSTGSLGTKGTSVAVTEEVRRREGATKMKAHEKSSSVRSSRNVGGNRDNRHKHRTAKRCRKNEEDVLR